MPLSPGLDKGSAAWRAGRAAVTLAAVLDARLAADDGLDALVALGVPEEGWWSVLGDIRQAPWLEVRLPRSGDPRGVPLPRHVSADAAVGWSCHDGGSRWLIPTGGIQWLTVHSPETQAAGPDAEEAARTLRSEVVRVAHVLDPDTPARGEARERSRIERDVDSWILGPPALPGQRRALASMSLRILLSITRAGIPRAEAGADRLERAARAGVEAAFSSRVNSG